MFLSKNFNHYEFIKSATASRLGIDNTPSEQEWANLKTLCQDVLQPLRDAYGKPIRIGSGFRCKALNTAVGGAVNSQHVKGQAADITSVTDTKKDNRELMECAMRLIRDGKIKVGQIIDEFDCDWIHISTPDGRHLNQYLKARKTGNKTVYTEAKI